VIIGISNGIGCVLVVVMLLKRMKKMECRICGIKLSNGNNRYGMVICDVCYYKMCMGEI
jgi:hypothetical protein